MLSVLYGLLLGGFISNYYFPSIKYEEGHGYSIPNSAIYHIDVIDKNGKRIFLEKQDIKDEKSVIVAVTGEWETKERSNCVLNIYTNIFCILIGFLIFMLLSAFLDYKKQKAN